QQVNPGVTPDLERILAHTLARDPAVRYDSARDLGRDLTAFLYRLGKPVSSFDIAELVLGAMALRKKAQPDKASIIDKLIEEALFEFPSPQDHKAPAKTDEPLRIAGFEDIGKWADEINISGGGAAAPRQGLASAFEEGNL